ncbi:hypothetical protein [Nocardioides sp. SYSU DS0651]|uniref:hypothetical protein n=1 Tax=Nocardioides sp. SYSU DS0651 TaxID=3415955 RepID=UPI003F4C207E
MRHLRPTAIAGLLLAAVALLSSCGFDYATDRVNQLGAGANEREPSVDALGMQVASDSRGEGRLIGALVNNLEDEASLVGVVPGSSDDDETVRVEEFEPVDVAPRGHVNLLTEADPIRLTGDFAAGDVVELTLEYSTGERATLNVLVVKVGCFYFQDIPLPSDDPGDEATPDDTYLCPAEIREPGHGEGGH